MKYLFTFVIALVAASTSAQEAPAPKMSPMMSVMARYKDSYLRVIYNSPQKRGREIFGNLVPFGQVWRTGANEATEIILTRDIKINSFDLKAGTYSVFSIPEKDRWTIIFNSDLGLMGSYNYNSRMDVLRFEVSVTNLADVVYEAFTIGIDQRNEKADLVISWDKTRVIIPIQFLEPKL